MMQFTGKIINKDMIKNSIRYSDIEVIFGLQERQTFIEADQGLTTEVKSYFTKKDFTKELAS